MTRKKEEATAGLRRGRTLATAGLGAATLIGGLVYAAPANAATPTNPTVTVTAPTQISNDGADATLTLGVNNTQAGNLAISGVTYDLTLTVPSGVNCSAVTVSPGTNFALSQVGSTCEWQSASSTLAAGANLSDSDTITITAPGVTGAVTAKFAVETLDSNGFVTHTFGSATGTSQLVSPHAPAFNSSFTGDAAIYVPFSEQLVSDAGLSTSGTAYTAYGFTKDANGNWITPAANIRSAAGPATVGSGATAHVDQFLNLSDSGVDTTGFFFDETSGDVVYGTYTAGAPGTFVPTSPSALDISTVTWVVVANNGVGGTDSGQPLSTNPPLTSPADHSVASPSFQLNVGFKDVPSSNPFKADIDALAGQNDPVSGDPVVQGFADGNFGIAKPVTRGQFAAFIVRELNAAGAAGAPYAEGACPANTSGFSDVPDASQFCEEINELAAAGVINGYTDGTFRPSTELSRQVVAGMFFRTNDVVQGSAVGDATPIDTKFPDVKSDNVFSGDINWAVNTTPTTIINGYTDGTFRPTGVATRQVTAGYLARFAQDYLGQFSGVTGL